MLFLLQNQKMSYFKEAGWIAALSFEGEESPNSEGECIPITSERRLFRPVRIRATETSSPIWER